MSNNNSAIKSIGELNSYHFLIEDYQRGYKWTKTEVNQLLTDINEFEGKSFYCLQPVVVKKIKDKEVDKIELIDGQQRMTTIYIVFAYLNQKEYSIEYKTRESSRAFLQGIEKLDKVIDDWNEYINTNGNDDNIDNYHFFTAYQTIKEWFNDKNNALRREEFLSKLKDKVKVIWYEVPQTSDGALSKQESIKIFTRLNNGKISLTNAELIKALFLINVDEGKNAALLQLKQNEIAQQWDTIEYALQNDAFWYFLSNKTPIATRIELIFDLIKDKHSEEQEELFTFLKYNEDFAQKSDKIAWVEDKWAEVYETFLTLQEWYEDRKLYHFIGFLVCSKIQNISDLYKDYNSKQSEITKVGWIELIKSKIKEKIKDYNLDGLTYNENKDKPKINQLLLLYNIETELKNDESNSKYPFDRHKQHEWSLEHIHAQNESELNSAEKMIQFANDFLAYTNILVEKPNTTELLELKKRLELKGVFDKNIFQLFIDKAKGLFPDLFDLHTLDNMALLPGPLNSSIGKGFFNEKRAKIIEFDKKGEFIPICTRNVFLKYYSEANSTNLFYWSSTDREDYLENVKCTLKKYIDYTCKTTNLK